MLNEYISSDNITILTDEYEIFYMLDRYDEKNVNYVQFACPDSFDLFVIDRKELHGVTIETAKRYSNTMEWALAAVKEGKRVSRRAWLDEERSPFIFKVDGSTFTVNREPLLSILGDGVSVDYNAHIDMTLSNGSIMVWSPSQVDMFANDWYEYNGTL